MAYTGVLDEPEFMRRHMRDLRKWRRSLPPGHYNSYVRRYWPLAGHRWHWVIFVGNRRFPLCKGVQQYFAEASATSDPGLECKRCRAELQRRDGTLWTFAKGGA